MITEKALTEMPNVTPEMIVNLAERILAPKSMRFVSLIAESNISANSNLSNHAPQRHNIFLCAQAS